MGGSASIQKVREGIDSPVVTETDEEASSGHHSDALIHISAHDQPVEATLTNSSSADPTVSLTKRKLQNTHASELPGLLGQMFAAKDLKEAIVSPDMKCFGHEAVRVEIEAWTEMLLIGKYTGRTLHGKAHGQGLFHYESIKSFAFQLEKRDSRVDGEIDYFKKEITFKGESKEGVFHGHGRLMLKSCCFGSITASGAESFNVNTSRYTGDWLGGLMHGCGELSYFVQYSDHSHRHDISIHGPSYSGNFRDGLFHGHGVLKFSPFYIFEGNFERGSFHGDGVLKKFNGAIIYSGKWSNGEQERRGALHQLLTRARLA